MSHFFIASCLPRFHSFGSHSFLSHSYCCVTDASLHTCTACRAANISFPAAPYLKPYPCAKPPPGMPPRPAHAGPPGPGRWCGMEGQIKDMKALGVNPSNGQLQPGVWMDACNVEGTMTQQGWTQIALRGFLEYASAAGVRVITIWAMNDNCGSLCHPSSSYTGVG